ncbi:hypothetical protein mRhiFer1_008009 [Rhinolophus ferrumequinum]|uniref:Uncharacterized protein n=1 Tax=Rhinolophus ferrumequinum TaxID=59479 RepID=A0A7J7WRA0_RHIFE|nr:hypothetical protein mRhiFer1_008009 [Rhinolophus ferrumequinum]
MLARSRVPAWSVLAVALYPVGHSRRLCSPPPPEHLCSPEMEFRVKQIQQDSEQGWGTCLGPGTSPHPPAPSHPSPGDPHPPTFPPAACLIPPPHSQSCRSGSSHCSIASQMGLQTGILYLNSYIFISVFIREKKTVH